MTEKTVACDVKQPILLTLTLLLKSENLNVCKHSGYLKRKYQNKWKHYIPPKEP